MAEVIIREKKGIDYPTEQFRQYDKYTHSLTVIDEQHRLAHDGAMYIYSVLIEGLAKNAELQILVVQEPIVPPAHIRQWRVIFDKGPLVLRAYENVVVTNPGNETFPRNQNRNFPDTGSSLKFYTGATMILDPANELLVQLAPKDGPKETKALGEEWILETSDVPKNYALSILNTGNKTDLSFDLYWYVPPYPEKTGVK